MRPGDQQRNQMPPRGPRHCGTGMLPFNNAGMPMSGLAACSMPFPVGPGSGPAPQRPFHCMVGQQDSFIPSMMSNQGHNPQVNPGFAMQNTARMGFIQQPTSYLPQNMMPWGSGAAVPAVRFPGQMGPSPAPSQGGMTAQWNRNNSGFQAGPVLAQDLRGMGNISIGSGGNLMGGESSRNQSFRRSGDSGRSDSEHGDGFSYSRTDSGSDRPRYRNYDTERRSRDVSRYREKNRYSDSDRDRASDRRPSTSKDVEKERNSDWDKDNSCSSSRRSDKERKVSRDHGNRGSNKSLDRERSDEKSGRLETGERNRNRDTDRGQNRGKSVSESQRDKRSEKSKAGDHHSSSRPPYKSSDDRKESGVTSKRYDSRSDRSKRSYSQRWDRDSSRDNRDSKRSRYDISFEEVNPEGQSDDNESVDGSSATTKPDASPQDDTPSWLRCSPADLYFTRDTETSCLMSTKRMTDLEDKFRLELVERARQVKANQPVIAKPPRPPPRLHHHHHHHSESDSDSSNSSSSSCDSDSDAENAPPRWIEELNRKRQHPYHMHDELWYNDPGEMNDGPLCQCSLKSQRSGIRHNLYPGEQAIPNCNPKSNNLDKLYHYHITMSPSTNLLTKSPTVIEYDNHEYIFEGFSLFSHYKLENIPLCKVIRFNIEYTIHFFEEHIPENFSIRGIDLFSEFLFTEILELVDIDWCGPNTEDEKTGCQRYHLMPRFARGLPENGKEILSINEVLNFLLRSSKPLLEETELAGLLKYSETEWTDMVDEVRGMIVTYPGKKPSSIRIDQLDRQQLKRDVITYPLIIHFGVRPPQLSYAGDPIYQKEWKQYMKYKHLLNSKAKVTVGDKLKLEAKEQKLNSIMKISLKREVTVELSSEGFLRTGLKSDICQHAMLLPVLLGHLRFHKCLDEMEKHIEYKFKDRYLLQLALTHTSYTVNYGTNPDHARNSLTNCGMRQVEYGDRKIHFVHTRKRGINILMDIMSRQGRKEETASKIPHNERLEFLGDAVVEFLSSVHLYFMFPWLEEGGLSTYRTAIVQNQNLSILAKKLRLQDFMLYAHGPDLCHESDLKHAMANCFEALIGALFMDGGVELTDRIFTHCLFEEDKLLSTWSELPLHPLQEDEPNGDRHWQENSPILQKLATFEESVGIKFDHVRLLAKAFTLRNVGYNFLTLGHNQRLEFLGDTVLQLVASEFLFKHFPEHHEGHLSLLRSSLVNNRTQAIVCDDLNMTDYVIFDRNGRDKNEMKTKEKADLLEAFLGSLFVDKDLDYCRVFCQVCFFPRLRMFIMNQDWNDPKSQLQQCCLTLRELDGGEPDIPVYKVIESQGPTNTRMYVVAVYFRGERLATGTGHSKQQAEMSAATNALSDRGELFPILDHQKRFLQHKLKMDKQRRYCYDSRGSKYSSSDNSSPQPRKKPRYRR
ncbi:ribonuclease 3-like isoform X2 [Gigantopelta aegis]|uniref:ribonuclease 3-like isoform X2 n=1 Tax=Gigantopelta aegis TaxID=1735272 RepID=UPI001B889A48|nr:ribonuclease 3-like isoform X2 [Gigantopelta aegis]